MLIFKIHKEEKTSYDLIIKKCPTSINNIFCTVLESGNSEGGWGQIRKTNKGWGSRKKTGMNLEFRPVYKI